MDDRLQRVEAELKEARTGIARMTMLISLFMLTLIALVVAAAMVTDIFKVEYNGTTRFQVDDKGTTTINADSSSPDVALKIMSASTSRGDMKFSVRAADPTAPGAGDLWYNSTENRYKLYDGSFKRYVLFDLPQVVDDESTVNNNYGTRGTNAVVGSDDPTWTTDAQLGGCTLSFDGADDYVGLGFPSGVNFNAPASVEGWVKSASDTPRSLFAVSEGATTNNYMAVFIGGDATSSLTNELVTIFRKVGGATIYTLGYTTTTRTELIGSGWHHVAVTFDGSEIKLYLDGQAKILSVGLGSNNGTFGGVTNPTDANVGSYLSNSSRTSFFSGLIDEVAIWNVALTPAQVSARYNGGAGAELVGNEAGLVSVWHFNDPK